MAESAIQIVYKCGCMAAERTITMRTLRKDEDPAAWGEYFIAKISEDHRAQFPDCSRRKMEYAKLAPRKP